MFGHVGKRSRWVASGAVVAMMLGAGGVLTSSAASTAASSFIGITPCRLMDTRPAPDNVGTRSTPLGAGETYTAAVRGTNGNCTIPASATGVSMNVTIVLPTSASFLTVFPSDAARPLTANLNWVAGQAPTPNAVTVALSAAGAVSFYNLSGTVHLTADIVGYYEPATSGPAGPAGPAGPGGPAGPTGAAGTARAHAYVTAAGTFSRSKNVVAVTRPEVGMFCVALAPSIVAAEAVFVVSPDKMNDSTAFGTNFPQAIVEVYAGGNPDCAPNSLTVFTGHRAVTTANNVVAAVSNVASDQPFMIIVG